MQAIDLFTLLFPPEKPLEEAKIIVRGRFPDEIPVIARYLNKELYFHAEILFTKEITNEQAVACLNRAIDDIFADDYDGPNYIGSFPVARCLSLITGLSILNGAQKSYP